MSYMPISYIPRHHSSRHTLSPWTSSFPTTNLFTNEVAPFFRLLDDTTNQLFNSFNTRDSARTFQPRFDVKEEEGAYQLRGELPGVENENLDVQFTDEKTLTVRGSTEKEVTKGKKTAAALQEDQEAKAVEQGTTKADDAASQHSSTNYVKPTVEDESAATEGETAKTPEATHAAASAEAAKEPQAQEQDYWYSERTTGTFQRTFNFPAAVDQDGVTASLKNGVLSMTVPKAKKPEGRRIEVA